MRRLPMRRLPMSRQCRALNPVILRIGNSTKHEKMVVGAVLSEPVSGLFSLLTGKKQGKFTIFG
jgi:hypothetical protein